ncbi:NADAR family protein [Proteus vulgaris]|uniref:NADAR family protein n=1 Tax=Proteus TaxID=583 RepID=UPI001D0A2AC1|nr:MULTISPECIES: NADAR family protein [Proteus]UDN36053.1 NADAR family protein [Proteus sp. NMG38-2]UPK81105.1 NADAR family protein [Proteus vulgaris]
MDLEQLKKDFRTGKKIKFVYFWGHKSKTDEVTKSCFSQWYPAPFILDDIRYISAEHYMMAEKAKLFNDIEIRERIIATSNPGTAKALGREVKGFNQEIWEQQRMDIVIRANIAKFSQNNALGTFLISTGNRVLVEASPVDKIWGVGLSEQDKEISNPLLWNGLNLLGFALMKVRSVLMEGSHQ